MIFSVCRGPLIAGVLDSLESFQSASRDGRLFLASALSKALLFYIQTHYSVCDDRDCSVRDYICRQVGFDGLNHQTKLQIVLIWDKIVWWATTEFRRSRLMSWWGLLGPSNLPSGQLSSPTWPNARRRRAEAQIDINTHISIFEISDFRRKKSGASQFTRIKNQIAITLAQNKIL